MLTPDTINTLGQFLAILVKIGVTEAPDIVAMIQAAIAGEDPIKVLASERVETIMPGYDLELALAAEHLRRAHLASIPVTP